MPLLFEDITVGAPCELLGVGGAPSAAFRAFGLQEFLFPMTSAWILDNWALFTHNNDRLPKEAQSRHREVR